MSGSIPDPLTTNERSKYMPYSDDMLTYDPKRHRYYLNPDSVGEHPYRDEVELVKNLKAQSGNLYSWIYSQMPKFNRNYAEYVLACAGEYREALYLALQACYEADIKSGYSDLKNYPQDASGAPLSASESLERLVPIEARLQLRSVGEPNIFYIGIFPTLPGDRYSRYRY